ncbi:hypothetical protein WJX74_000512 [Apatococcus lobatus]|uniref:FAD-binding domain-containing protein n=1 Tax=Apatococcus lobatus TaxID=904363 RepID=A0AAW1SBA4_9CHLO
MLRTSFRFSSSIPSPEGQIPVVIAGAGPTGLTLALLLSRLRIPSLLVDRAAGLTTHPQAHFINNRTMEVFRPLAGLAEEVRSMSPPLDQWRKFIYCERVTGHIYGEVDHFWGQNSPHMRDLSPVPVTHLSQNRLVPLLLKRVQAGGLCDVRFSNRVDGYRVVKSGLRVTITSEQGRPFEVDCSYLVGCDGARSFIRGAAGIGMKGPAALQHLVNIHFFCPDLWQHISHRPAMLYFVFNSEVVSVLVGHDLPNGELVAQVPIYPPQQSLEDFTPEVCQHIVRQSIGLPDIPVRLGTVRQWTMSSQVANRFQAGRLFLAGDAAHCFPPAGGFGMNTGIQDAHNLAWKLAAAVQGQAGGDLLQSYSAERRPIAQANADLSVANFQDAIRVPQALGLDPRAANFLHSAVSTLFPTGASRALLSMGMAAGRSMGGTKGPLRSWRQAALSKILAAGDSLRLQFPREDLGYIYKEPGAALISEADVAASASEPLTHQSTSRTAPFEQSTAIGARLPHCDVHLAGNSADCQVLSTHALHDCFPEGSFLLLLGPLPAAAPWLAALPSLVDSWQLGVICIASGSEEVSAQHKCLARSGNPNREYLPIRAEACTAWNGAATQVDDQQAAPDTAGDLSPELSSLVMTLEDPASKWKALRKLALDGAMLVRPDGHIAWRCRSLAEARKPGQAAPASCSNRKGQHCGKPAHEAGTKSAAGASLPAQFGTCNDSLPDRHKQEGVDWLEAGAIGALCCSTSQQDQRLANRLVHDAMSRLLA